MSPQEALTHHREVAPRKRRDLTQAEMDRAVARNGFDVAVFGLRDIETGRLTPWVESRRGRFDFRATLASAIRDRRSHETAASPERRRRRRAGL